MRDIYCDMDGVLVDFLTGAVLKMNEVLLEPPEEFRVEATNVVALLGRAYIVKEDLEKYTDTSCEEARSFMYTLLEDDVEFWANLPWMPGGQELWEYIKEFNPRILTSPMDKCGKKGSLEGKKRWLNKNLGLTNIRELIFEHDKFEYALSDDGEPNILIDDFMAKVGPWRDNGGIGIHHENGDAVITISALEDLRDAPRSS